MIIFYCYSINKIYICTVNLYFSNDNKNSFYSEQINCIVYANNSKFRRDDGQEKNFSE
jgi:hypothetical protein